MTKTSLRLGAAVLGLSASALAQQTDGIDTIVVTGSPLDRTQDDLLTGASVLDGEALQRRAANTIGETLRLEPGLSETQFGAGASRPIIRGLGGDRVRILTNGIGSIDASSASPDHAVAVEPATAERIEVIRGTGLLRYGSSAAGGVVNVLDGRIPDEALDSGTGAFRVQGATVDDSVEASGTITTPIIETGSGTLMLNLQGAWRDAQDYEIPVPAESNAMREAEGEPPAEGGSQILENSFVETKSGAAGLSFVGERGFFGASLKETRTTYGIPAGHEHEHGDEHAEEGHEDEHEGEEHHEDEHDHAFAEEDGVFIELEQTRVDLNGRIALGGAFQSLDVFGGYADYSHTEFEGPGMPGTVFSNEGWEARVELTQTARGGWRGASGVQMRLRDFSAIGEEAFVPPTDTEQWGAYTFQEYQSGPLHAEAALRIEKTDYDQTSGGPSRDFTGISGSLGAGYDITDNMDVALTLSRTERAPTTEELFSNGPHLATDQYEVGDIDLGLETALGAEALFHVHGARGNASVNLFYTDYDDFVYERDSGLLAEEYLAGQGVTDPEELEEFGALPVYQFTAADATFRGFEVFGRVLLAEAGGVSFRADGALDYVDTDLSGTDEALPRIPPLGLTGGLEAEGRGASLRFEVDHAAEQDDPGANVLPTDSYTLLNLYGTYAVTDRLTVRGAVLNMTDAEARLATSFLKDEVPLPGRNVRISLGYTF